MCVAVVINIHPLSHASARAGIVLTLFRHLAVPVNDALGKWLVASYSVGQVLLIRSAAARWCWRRSSVREGVAPFREAPKPALQIIRVLFFHARVAGFYRAVAYLPLADATTFYLAAPIYVTAISALFSCANRSAAALERGDHRVHWCHHRAASDLRERNVPALIALAGSVSSRSF